MELGIQFIDKKVQDKKLLPIKPNKSDIYSAGDWYKLALFSVKETNETIDTLEW